MYYYFYEAQVPDIVSADPNILSSEQVKWKR